MESEDSPVSRQQFDGGLPTSSPQQTGEPVHTADHQRPSEQERSASNKPSNEEEPAPNHQRRLVQRRTVGNKPRGVKEPEPNNQRRSDRRDRRDGSTRHVRPRPRAREKLVDRPVAAMENEVIELSGRLSTGTYELLVLIGELDLRGTWPASGALTCATWLARTCDVEVSTARTQVRVARAMLQFPALDQAMASGDVSYAKARVLVAYLTDDNVDQLLDIAERTPASRLGIAIAAWSQRNDDEETIRRRQMEARYVSWRTEPDGMVVITARLTPESAGAVCASIETVVRRGGAPAGATLGQQRADALVAVTTSGGAVQAEVVVHVNSEGNSFVDGTPLSDHAVAAMLPESFVSLLIYDAKRNPIDASPRRRFPTKRQRRVLDQIDKECRRPGCGVTEFLQYDHKQPYSEGGLTILKNMQRLCGPHNRARSSQPGTSP